MSEESNESTKNIEVKLTEKENKISDITISITQTNGTVLMTMASPLSFTPESNKNILDTLSKEALENGVATFGDSFVSELVDIVNQITSKFGLGTNLGAYITKVYNENKEGFATALLSGDFKSEDFLKDLKQDFIKDGLTAVTDSAYFDQLTGFVGTTAGILGGPGVGLGAEWAVESIVSDDLISNIAKSVSEGNGLGGVDFESSLKKSLGDLSKNINLGKQIELGVGDFLGSERLGKVIGGVKGSFFGKSVTSASKGHGETPIGAIAGDQAGKIGIAGSINSIVAGVAEGKDVEDSMMKAVSDQVGKDMGSSIGKHVGKAIEGQMGKPISDSIQKILKESLGDDVPLNKKELRKIGNDIARSVSKEAGKEVKNAVMKDVVPSISKSLKDQMKNKSDDDAKKSKEKSKGLGARTAEKIKAAANSPTAKTLSKVIQSNVQTAISNGVEQKTKRLK